MRSCPKPQTLSLTFFYHYISVHCPKTQALSLKVFYHYISVYCPKTLAKFTRIKRMHTINEVISATQPLKNQSLVFLPSVTYTHKLEFIFSLSLSPSRLAF